MFQFIKKYSPGYGRNTIEGWSVIPVVAVGMEASTFADSWLGMASAIFSYWLDIMNSWTDCFHSPPPNKF